MLMGVKIFVFCIFLTSYTTFSMHCVCVCVCWSGARVCIHSYTHVIRQCLPMWPQAAGLELVTSSLASLVLGLQGRTTTLCSRKTFLSVFCSNVSALSFAFTYLYSHRKWTHLYLLTANLPDCAWSCPLYL